MSQQCFVVSIKGNESAVFRGQLKGGVMSQQCSVVSRRGNDSAILRGQQRGYQLSRVSIEGIQEHTRTPGLIRVAKFHGCQQKGRGGAGRVVLGQVNGASEGQWSAWGRK
ncbi:hypothetical protein Pcinc_026546 [Petrolisthes cinctipes]|uniref:Uncharacterized protein n=1 Tax=Petrolisthes cinctipes TaxID=88211 RepID=A0AAE1F6R4_PETCI|nr:hypothetical protein Pcinc_026546 [Petrolisthes cinctipes]